MAAQKKRCQRCQRRVSIGYSCHCDRRDVVWVDGYEIRLYVDRKTLGNAMKGHIYQLTKRKRPRPRTWRPPTHYPVFAATTAAR